MTLEIAMRIPKNAALELRKIFDSARIEIGLGVAAWASLVFVVSQSGLT